MNLAAFKTINLYLPSGNPTGLRVAEQTTSIVRVIEFPRLLLSEFFSRIDSHQSGIYILFNSDQYAAYIGQSSNISDRIKQHHSGGKKEWDRAIAVVSMTNNFTVSHTLQLEKIAISEANLAKRYQLINSTAGNQLNISESLEADCYQIFDIAKLLVSTLGYRIFEPMDNEKDLQHDEDLFFCKRKDANASGTLTNEGFLVFKDSHIASVPNKSFDGSGKQVLAELIDRGIIVNSDEGIYFSENFLFKSPSAAAKIICQSSANGWTEFKNKDGVSLSDKYRENG